EQEAATQLARHLDQQPLPDRTRSGSSFSPQQQGSCTCSCRCGCENGGESQAPLTSPTAAAPRPGRAGTGETLQPVPQAADARRDAWRTRIGRLSGFSAPPGNPAKPGPPPASHAPPTG